MEWKNWKNKNDVIWVHAACCGCSEDKGSLFFPRSPHLTHLQHLHIWLVSRLQATTTTPRLSQSCLWRRDAFRQIRLTWILEKKVAVWHIIYSTCAYVHVRYKPFALFYQWDWSFFLWMLQITKLAAECQLVRLTIPCAPCGLKAYFKLFVAFPRKKGLNCGTKKRNLGKVGRCFNIFPVHLMTKGI